MDQEDTKPNEEAEGEPIPELLHSVYEDRPFRTCTRCGESLGEFEDGYRITKEFRKGEVVLEYAICHPCLDRMLEESSVESKLNLVRFHEEHFKGPLGFNQCAFCGKVKSEVRGDEYAIAGMCLGSRLMERSMVCGECVEAMHAVLSEHTTRIWRRFREENFPGVPGDFEPFPGENLTHKKVY